jgi:hypothetical protein
MNLATPKYGAKLKLLFKKPAFLGPPVSCKENEVSMAVHTQAHKSFNIFLLCTLPNHNGSWIQTLELRIMSRSFNHRAIAANHSSFVAY